ncbi:MAG TPA: hypothetical protein VK809_11365 [Bacteroidia bacterium]|nr:hypothetical protein [Bacteroidia bacterium]
MKEILQSKYARFFMAGLVLNIICAWFSKGFYHPDEHYQILEFCNYKLGNATAASLPWEFTQKMRASLLPYIAYLLARFMQLCGFYNPFTLAFLLRLFTGIITWFVVSKFCLLMCKKFKSPKAEKLFILMSFLLWFIPFLSVRFTAENISGLLLLYGLYLILQNNEKANNSLKTYIIAGFLFGISFFIRFQMAFALVGVIGWLIFVKKIKFKYLAILTLSALIAIGSNILLDYLFYGEIIFTPYNYYYANIILHKAADFGVNPWWFFFTEFITKAAPPISIVLLIMFFAGLVKNYKTDPAVWILIPFIFLHFLTPHKELRFLFPALFLFIYCAALGFDYFMEKPFYQKIHPYVYTVSLIICIPLLIYQTMVPPQTSVCYTRFLYDNVPEKGTVLLVLNKDYDMTVSGLCEGIYKPAKLSIVKIDSLPLLTEYIQNKQLKTALFMTKENINPDSIIKGYKAEIVYCFYPSWVLKFNINNWESRSSIWRIYQISKTD